MIASFASALRLGFSTKEIAAPAILSSSFVATADAISAVLCFRNTLFTARSIGSLSLIKRRVTQKLGPHWRVPRHYHAAPLQFRIERTAYTRTESYPKRT